MACTPYPFGDDRAENPILRVSNDGLQWHLFPETPDPLVPPPSEPGWHHADTDLVIHNNVLHLFYISTNRFAADTTFSLITSSDGVHWTQPIVIYHREWGVSPAVIVNKDGKWLLWYIWRDALSNSQISQLYMCTADVPIQFGSPQLCTLTIPGYVVWHLDVMALAKGYEALVAAFPIGTDTSRCCLFHAYSSDGIRFVVSSRSPIAKPSLLGWDNRVIYRSTFIKLSNTNYRIWYSASSWARRWGIGVLEGPLAKLRPVNIGTHSYNPTNIQKIQEDLIGIIRYSIIKIMPKNIISIIRSINNKLRSN